MAEIKRDGFMAWLIVFGDRRLEGLMGKFKREVEEDGVFQQVIKRKRRAVYGVIPTP